MGRDDKEPRNEVTELSPTCVVVNAIRSVTALLSTAAVIGLLGLYPGGEPVVVPANYKFVYLLAAFAFVAGYRPLILGYRIQRHRVE